MFTLLVGFTSFAIFLDLFFLITFIGFTENELFPVVFAELFVIIPLILYFVFSINVYTIAATNPFILILGFIGYILIGMSWSYFKWSRYVNSEKIQDEIRSRWEAYQVSYANRKVVEQTDRDNLRKDFLESTYNPVLFDYQQRWKVMNWIFLWPFSFVWSFSREITIELGKTILDKTKQIYMNIAKKAIKLD